jgi:hypothetical protein
VSEAAGLGTTGHRPRKPNSHAKRRATGLEADIARIAESLCLKWAQRARTRPKAFKARVISLMSLYFPPFPKPSGRPKQNYITRATDMFAQQQRAIETGLQAHTNWLPIAVACIPGFSKIRSVAKRKEVIGRLQSSVYARWRAAPKRRNITNKSGLMH